MDELLKQVAELRGMPVSLVERSAQAKADKTGTTLEAVLREWAGDADTAVPEPAAEVAATADTEPQSTPKDSSDEPPAQSAPAVTTDYLVQLAADAKRMPAKLILSSAQARSTHSGTPLDEVLADWAGADLDELKATAEATAADTAERSPQPASEPVPAPESAPESPTAAQAATVGAVALTMDELLEKVAEAKGMPASLAQRSAEARSKKTGEPVEVVLQEWAGIEAVTIATPSTEAPAAASAPSEAAATPEEASTDETGDAEEVEIIDAAPIDISDVPETDEETQVTRGGYPVWLAAAFVLIPLLAVAYILVSPNGPDCGSGGQLLVDPVTGEATNCDGSAYGDTIVDHFDAGGSLYQQCVACHSNDGSGGVGPAFTGGSILAVFPQGSCADHVEWVGLGTAGWPDATYGATDKTVGGVGLMPGFAGSLSEEQLAQVSLYERVQFGGQDLAEAEVDCGLVEAGAEG